MGANHNRIIVNVAQLSQQGSVQLEGELPPEIFALPENDRLTCKHPLEYSLNGAIVGGGVLVEGRAGTVLDCRCDRCLKPFKCEIVADEVCHFFEGLEEREIDLTEDIREDIVIGFPEKCLCDEDCNGLCPKCGQNLNEAVCDCSDDDDAPSVWDKLNGLDL